MSISIRPATLQDIDPISQVNVACWQSAYRDILGKDFLAGLSPQGFAEHNRQRFSQEGTHLLAAETPEHGIIGFCAGGPNRGRPREYEAEIYSIYILDAYQSNGLGKRLVHAMCTLLEAAHFASVIIWTFRDNPNRPFYDALGGRVARESTFEIGGVEYHVVGYGWKDIRELLKRAEPNQYGQEI